MRFKDELEKLNSKEIYNEYCGFLDLSIEDYMKIQFRLLKEQIEIFSKSGLGKHIMKNGIPSNVSEFRDIVPLTKYDDYQGALLEKREDMLPIKPFTWLKTTWESGNNKEKWAPYTKEMLDVYKRNIIAAMILSTSNKKYSFKVKTNAKVLYGLAPMPYATGLFPYLIKDEIDLKFMPSLKEVKNLSFSKQNKEGFKQALKQGIDQFFGMTSVVYAITSNFDSMINGNQNGGLKSLSSIRPSMLYKILKAKYVSKRDDRKILPKDLFNLNGFVCVGTDTAIFKHELEESWGIRPLEIHGGTETSCLATETYEKNGLIFFPDNAFYEFIPKEEMLKNEENPDYIPKTYLMDEVLPNEEYELVVTIFKGGAFMRYRPGDMYRCIRIGSEESGIQLPYFEYVDRIPSVIDIQGFTRFTENSINNVIELSGLPIDKWFALKEYIKNKKSIMHLYVEVDMKDNRASFLTEELILEHLGAYYKKYDHDYDDLKKLLNMEPAKVTIIPKGSIDNYEKEFNKKIRKINPSILDVTDLLNSIGGSYGRNGGYYE